MNGRNRTLRSIPAIAVVAMLLATGCSHSTTAAVSNNSVEITSPSGGVTNNTTNETSTTNATNTTDQNSSPNTTSGTVTSDQAVQLVTDMYKAQLKAHPKLKVTMDHTDTDNNHKYFVIHVFDDLSDHVATIAWVHVRDDGMVRDGIVRGNWMTVDEFKAQNNLS